jgi:(p)ppGpp synthase/HD superfamily hydrolase
MGLRKKINELKDYFGGAAPVAVTPETVARALEVQQRAQDVQEEGIPYNFAESIARRLGLDPQESVAYGPIKRLPSIFNKVPRFDGDPQKLPDVGRLRVLVDNADQILAIRKMFLGNKPHYDGRKGDILDKHPNNYVTLTEFEDYFLRPSNTGRVAIHIGTIIDGLPYEIQILHKDMLETEDFTHDNYKQAERLKAEIAKLSFDQVDLIAEKREAIEHYHESNRQRYAGDIKRLGLGKLLHPHLQKAMRKADSANEARFEDTVPMEYAELTSA